MLQLFRPIKTDLISQRFGESKACINSESKIVGKKDNECPQGYEDFYKSIGLKSHNGLDLASWYGEPVYHSANFDGWMRTEIDFGGGIGVDIVSNEPILQCTELDCLGKHYIKARYWHGLDVEGYDKMKVETGDPIMYSDSTGASSGNHVHFAIKWCKEGGQGIHIDNGYYGSFSPEPYYTNEFVLAIIEKKALPLSWRQFIIRAKFNIRIKIGL